MVVFQAVVVAVCVVSALVAITTFLRSRDLYERIGRLGSFWLVTDDDQGSPSRREVEEMRAAISAARRGRQAKLPADGPDKPFTAGPPRSRATGHRTAPSRAIPPQDSS